METALILTNTDLTPAAEWLNSVFHGFDYALLSFYHHLAEVCGWLFSPVLYVITLTGWKGAFLILASIAMIIFRKTRKTGLCALFAIGFGAVLTNLLIKNTVARPRPYAFDAEFYQWWEFVGSHMESEYSFPSGHTTVAAAFSTAFVYVNGKKWLPWAILYVVLMGISRNYFMVHYPSDVLGGAVMGVLGGVLSCLMFRYIYQCWGNSNFLKEAA